MNNNMRTPPSKTPPPTPKSTTKRKAEVIDLEVCEERTVKKPFIPVNETPAQKEEDALYQVSVTVNSKLDGFPRALREALQKSYQTACYMHMFAIQAGTIPKHHQTYSIIEGERIRSEAVIFTNTTTQHNILDLSIANIKLLELLADRTKDKLDKRTFVQLRTQGGLLNPEFIELHSVRHGELGWGFDTDGCLSLYATGVQEKKLKERVWYVTARGIKFEDA